MWAKIFEKSGNYLMLNLKSTTWFWASVRPTVTQKYLNWYWYGVIFEFYNKTATFFDSMAHSGAGG